VKSRGRPSRLTRRLGAWLLLLGVACTTVSGCGGAAPAPRDPLSAARDDAKLSNDADVVGRWLLAELLAPGGNLEQARQARKRLDALDPSRHVFGALALAIDDEAHGALTKAARSYLDVLQQARTYDGPEAPLVAWFATSRLVRLRPSVAGLWADARALVESAIDDPGRIGFRARGDLVDWSAYEARREAKLTRSAIDERMAERLGCARAARFAGPFGRPAAIDVVRSFDAERPGPWPAVFERDPRRLEVASVVGTERSACTLKAAEPLGEGIHYVETFLELEHARDVIVIVHGAANVRVDDVEVLHRDPREFGVWPRFGVALRLGEGRHRIVARLGSLRSDRARRRRRRATARRRTLLRRSIRALRDDSAAACCPTPTCSVSSCVPLACQFGAGLAARAQDARTHRRDGSGHPLPRRGAEPRRRAGRSRERARRAAHRLARTSDRALSRRDRRTSKKTRSSPATTRAISRSIIVGAPSTRIRASGIPALWIALDAADKQGPKEALSELASLASRFVEVPAVSKALASAYQRLGWRPERNQTVLESARRFPDDPELLRALLTVHDEQGQFQAADEVVARLSTLEPGAPLAAERALARGDLEGAARLLEQHARDAGDPGGRIARRAADLLVRAGRRSESLGLLEKALADEPLDPRARTRLADARLSMGELPALRRALADAIQAGAETDELRSAIELVEGMLELEPYRKDAALAIASYQASPSATAPGPGAGNAARVLDYAAIWVHRDGSARMLEHEILHMRTREAIVEHAEQRIPRGRVLRIRTVKADGRVFEPEIVSGKPTATMPHLEVGDFVETETIYDLPGDRRGGRSFLAPRWFFREEKVDYHLSEYVIISPKDRPLVVETTGDVPAPELVEDGAIVTRRWRVERSPALPEEPFSTRPDEFLPSVRAGWGLTRDEVVTRMVESTQSLVPPDPRLVRIARAIASDGAAADEQAAVLARLDTDTKARRIYRWVLENVEAGRETDPRRSVLGKSGSRVEAFVYLSRLVGIDVDKGVVRDRLAPPPRGPIDDAQRYSEPAVAVPSRAGGRHWMVVGDRYAPYGYLPSSLRDQPVVVLRPEPIETTTDAGGPPDRVTHRGVAKLAKDGGATVELVSTFEGKLAIDLRGGIERLDDDRLNDVIEAKLVPQLLPGARLKKLEVRALDDLDAPLELVFSLEVSSFARAQGDSLVSSPPFGVRLAPLASLPSRQTPLLIMGGLAIDTSVDFRIELPEGVEPPEASEPLLVVDGPRRYEVADRVVGRSLHLVRTISLPASRVPTADYPAFAEQLRKVGDRLEREIVFSRR
jgi:cellulose synthase operon protein C